MRSKDTSLRDVKLLSPRILADERGWFTEIFNAAALSKIGLPAHFAQDNQSHSLRGVLRGLHYQLGRPQGKLVRVLAGHIFDVAVDLRKDSPDFGKWAGFHLQPQNSAGDLEWLWIPEGFAHGFLVLSETADVLYKTTDGYYPEGERCIHWNDPELAIKWPLEAIGAPALSPKDEQGTPFNRADLP